MRNTVPDDCLHVAVGVLTDRNGRVLLTRRPAGKELAGLWEFPGGKIQPGETPRAALARELDEELGIRVERARPLIRIDHHYPHRRVLLEVMQVTRARGRATGREGQRLRWAAPETLLEHDLLAANRAIVHAVRLPPLYGVTAAHRYGATDMLRRLDAALAAGLRLVQVREPQMDAAQLRAFARRVRESCARSGAWMLLNADPALALECGADGVHLSGARWRAMTARPLPAELWVAASVHDEAGLDTVRALGVDFAVLGPVCATATHPDADPLGWKRFARIVRAAGIPVYAIGGMTLGEEGRARRAGGQGIAAIRDLWEGDMARVHAIARAAARGGR